MPETDLTTLVERLRNIQRHDWRFSFLGHTADTAGEAADALERLTTAREAAPDQRGVVTKEMIEKIAADYPTITKRLAESGRPIVTEPPAGLLMSMAIRYDHGLGLPGYYDNTHGHDPDGHQRRLQSVLVTMRQLWEEVAGVGFYRPEKEAEYAALEAALTGDRG